MISSQSSIGAKTLNDFTETTLMSHNHKEQEQEHNANMTSKQASIFICPINKDIYNINV